MQGNNVTLRHYTQQQLRPNVLETLTVPLIESSWQRQDGKPANREHLLMALGRVKYILVKATYTTTTSEVGSDIAASSSLLLARSLVKE